MTSKLIADAWNNFLQKVRPEARHTFDDDDRKIFVTGAAWLYQLVVEKAHEIDEGSELELWLHDVVGPEFELTISEGEPRQ